VESVARAKASGMPIDKTFEPFELKITVKISGCIDII
jgi:hypothetical protein